jgi:hypothetical protein
MSFPHFRRFRWPREAWIHLVTRCVRVHECVSVCARNEHQNHVIMRTSHHMAYVIYCEPVCVVCELIRAC